MVVEKAVKMAEMMIPGADCVRYFLFALLQDGFNHRGQALALVVLNAAFVGELGQGGVDGHTGQER